MKRRAVVLAFLLFCAVVLVLGIFSTRQRPAWPSKQVAVVEISGIILTGYSYQGGFFSQAVTGSQTVLSQFRQVEEDDSIPALLLRVNSPGGSVAGSQEIYRGIEDLRRAGKKVVASLADVAASGGYYIAAASDAVYALEGTLTGSIGAIFSLQNLEKLYEKIGIEQEVVKSGPYKDTGSPFRKMKPDERAVLQEVIKDVHLQFVRDVAKGRRLKEKEVMALADGRVFTGRQAKKRGLVDEIGGFRQALEKAAYLGGIEGEPRTVYLQPKRSVWDYLLQMISRPKPALHFPLLMYLYSPR